MTPAQIIQAISALATLSEADRAAIIAAASKVPSDAAPTAKEITHSDGILTAGRPPAKLFFFAVDGSTVHHFKGATIPGVAVIKSSAYNKNGKWSDTKYTITVSPKFAACELKIEMHQDGVFVGCGTFADAAARLKRSGAPAALTPDQAKGFLATHYPKAHERLAAAEAALAAL